jgi:hypothetical protein
MDRPKDLTFELIVKPGLYNLGRTSVRQDLLNFKPKRNHPIERIAIMGAGASLEETWQDVQAEDFVLTNQGSFARLTMQHLIPDAYVVVDPQEAATIVLITEPYGSAIPVLAATTAAVFPARPNTFFFKNMLHNPNGDSRYEEYNTIVEFMDEAVSTFMLQVGSVVNSSVLIANYLMEKEVLPKVPIVLHGVDGGSYKGKWRCYTREKYPKPDKKLTIADEFGHTTYAHQEYLSQLAFIHSQLPDLKLYTAAPNRCSKFLPVWKGE